MIILLDTSTATCYLTLVQDDRIFSYEWEAGRGLARGLLGYFQEKLAEHDKTFADISGIVGFRGPGSFTGLRIGITVLNTLANAQHIPIVGTTGEDWKAQGIERLKAGEDDKIILPHYGSDANITQPRK